MLVKNNFTHDARITREALALIEQGNDVHVVAIKSENTMEDEEISGIKVHRVGVKTFWIKRLFVKKGESTGIKQSDSENKTYYEETQTEQLKKKRRLRDRLWQIRWEWAFFRKAHHLRADVYQANDYNTLFTAWLCKLLNGAKLVYDSHDLTAECPLTEGTHFPSIKRWWIKKSEGFLIRWADRVMDTTIMRASVLWGRYKIDFPLVLHNYPVFRELRPNPDLRKSLNLSDASALLVYQGDFTKEKGIEENLLVMKYVRSDAVLLMIGDGPIAQKLRDLCERENLQSKVKFLGRKFYEEMLEWMASSDVGLCVISQYHFNFFSSLPNKIFESLMAGLPVVVSPFPLMGEMVSKNNLGVVAVDVKPEAIAVAIDSIIQDLKYWKSEAGRLKEYVRRYANWENEKVKLQGLYRELGRKETALWKTGW